MADAAYGGTVKVTLDVEMGPYLAKMATIKKDLALLSSKPTTHTVDVRYTKTGTPPIPKTVEQTVQQTVKQVGETKPTPLMTAQQIAMEKAGLPQVGKLYSAQELALKKVGVTTQNVAGTQVSAWGKVAAQIDKTQAAIGVFGSQIPKTAGEAYTNWMRANDALSKLKSSASKVDLSRLDDKQVSRLGNTLGLAEKRVASLRSTYEQFGATATRANNDSELSATKLFRTLGKASAVFLGIMALKGALEGIGAAIRAVVGEAARFEQVQIGFTKLYGGAAQAKAMLKDLADFASRTPFELKDTEQAAMRLKAYGFAASEVIPMLRDVGDTASALGTGQEGINRITLALGQMRSAGRVNARDMLQLTEAFIPAWQFIADALGTTTGKVREMTEKGLIPAEIGIAAIRKGMQKDFGGMMSAQMETLIGQWSNFKDRVTLAARPIGELLLPALKQVVSWATAQMPRVAKFFTELIKGTNDWGKAMRNIAVVVVAVVNGVVVPALTAAKDALDGIVKVLAGNFRGALDWAVKHPIIAAAGFVFLATKIAALINTVIALRNAYLGLAAAEAVAAVGWAGAAKGGAAGAAGAAGGIAAVTTKAAEAGGVIGLLGLAGGRLVKTFNSIKTAALAAAAGESIFGGTSITLTGTLGGLIGKLAAAAGGFGNLGAAIAAASVIGAAYVPPAAGIYASRLPQAPAKPPEAGSWQEKNLRRSLDVDYQQGYGRKISDKEFTAYVGRMKATYDAWLKEKGKLDEDSTTTYEEELKKQQDAFNNAIANYKFPTAAELMKGTEKQKSPAERAVDAAQKIDNLRSAQEAYNKALSEEGATSSKTALAGAQLRQAKLEAAGAQLEYKRATIEATLAEKGLGDVAAWASGIATNGAYKSASAQSALIGSINTAIAAYNQLAKAAANAANMALAQAQAQAYKGMAGVSENLAIKYATDAAEYERRVGSLTRQARGLQEAFKVKPGNISAASVGGVGGGGGGGGGGGVSKATTAIQKMKDVLEQLIKTLKSAAKEYANFAGGIFEKAERKRVGSVTSPLRSQVKKLEKYKVAVAALKKKLPASVFYELVESGASSMDEIIKLARGGQSGTFATLMQKRAQLSMDIAVITHGRDIAAAQREMVAAGRSGGVTVNVNMGGVNVTGYSSATHFVSDLTTLIRRELRASGLAGA